MNSTIAAPREAAPSQPSIVGHPWFPKVIALWFAALFGLSSLAMAPQMLENAVTALGIDQILPAAAPPLGQTARLLLALGMAGVGEIFGLLIGARLAAGRRPQPRRQRGVAPAAADDTVPQVRGRDRHADAPPRRPLSATAELSGIDHALRRRAQASEADHEPRPFFDVAPLPGSNTPGSDTPGSDTPGSDTPVETHAAVEAMTVVPNHAHQTAAPEAPDALDLAMFDAPEPHEAVQAAPFAAPPEPVSHDPVAAPFAAPPAFVAEAPEPVIASHAAPAAQIASASLDALGVVQLSERLAMALQARRARRVEALTSAVAVGPADIVASPVALVAEAQAPAFEPAPAAPLPRLQGLYAPFAEAGDDDETDDMPALARSLAMPAMPASFPDATIAAPEPVMPELQRGLDILARRAPRVDHVVDIELDTVPAEADDAAPGPDGDDGGEAGNGAYSSLLTLGSSFARPDPVRIEEPQSEGIEPVVIFPGQGARTPGPFSGPGIAAIGAAPWASFGKPAPVADLDPADTPTPLTPLAGATPTAGDAEETDRALRAALASLQRISGAR